MDQWLPVDPASVYGAGLYGPRFWRDILRSDPVEVSTTGEEPVSLAEAKGQALADADTTDFDAWFLRVIPAARRQVQRDTGFTLRPTTWEMTFDRYPLERWFPLSYPPITAIVGLFSTDIAGVETTVSTSTYYADLNMTPGRVILVPSQTWPTGTRNEQGGRVRWTAGYASPDAVPDTWRHAMLLLIAHWYENREAAGNPKVDPTGPIPFGYDALIGDGRVGMG